MSEPEILDIVERTTPIYQATLRKSPTGAVVPGSALTSLKVWLFDLQTGTILNDRDGEALSTALVSELGVFSWTLEEADTAILGTAPIELHQAEFEARWDIPEKVMRHKVLFAVENFVKTPVVVP